MVFQCFYVSAVRLHVGEVTKTINTMLRHDALKRAHVHENALGVTFGALRFGTHFRLPTLCCKTLMIHMLLGTRVPQTTVGVTFGARHRSSPLSLWDSPCQPLGPAGSPKDSGAVPPGARLGFDVAPG